LLINNDRLINISRPIVGNSQKGRELKEYAIKELKRNP
jgi:hypothetical protein